MQWRPFSAATVAAACGVGDTVLEYLFWFVAIAKQGCTAITAWCLGRCVDHCRGDSPIVVRSIINREPERQTVRIPLSAATPASPLHRLQLWSNAPVKCSTYAGKKQESTAATAVYVSLISSPKNQQPTNWLAGQLSDMDVAQTHQENSPFDFNSLKELG